MKRSELAARRIGLEEAPAGGAAYKPFLLRRANDGRSFGAMNAKGGGLPAAYMVELVSLFFAPPRPNVGLGTL